MNAKILRIGDKGDINNERIVVKILASGDVGRYAIFRSGKNANGTGITNRVSNTYWFPDNLVQPGDLIVLYTKAGTTSSVKNTDGTTTYFYYWGLSSAVWSSENYAAALVSIPEWNVHLE